MRRLWPIERAALEAIAKRNPAVADAVSRQADAAWVTSFKNSGAGFFSVVEIADDAAPLPALSHLGGACGTVAGIEHSMGFMVFFEAGRICLLEGWVDGPAPTRAVDFSAARFEVWPCCEAKE